MKENGLTVKEVYDYLGKLIEEGLGEMLGDEDCVNCGAKFTLGKRRR